MTQPSEVDTLRAVTAQACDLLTEPVRRRSANHYLLQRGIEAKALAEDWPLGYAPPGWTRLTDALRGAGFDDQVIQDAGLATRSSRGTLIDVFRDRVIFPIHDANSQVVGFSGRDLSGAPGAPKYLNTKRTAIFDKSAALYGLHALKHKHEQPVRPVVVEGPLDALAIAARTAQVGFRSLAPLASCGTAFTSRQAEMVTRIARANDSRVVVAMDGDWAGRTAALAAGRTIRRVGTDVRLAILPNGTDPASYLANPLSDLGALTHERALPLLTAEVQHAIAVQGDRMQWVEGRLGAVKEIASHLAEYPTVFAAGQLEWISRVLDVLPSTVSRAIEESARSATSRARSASRSLALERSASVSI